MSPANFRRGSNRQLRGRFGLLPGNPFAAIIPMPASLLSSRLARIVLLLSLAPLLLFAFLGSHSRMMADDYCHIDVARELGILQGMAHWRNTWNGSFTYYLVHGLLAPLGTTAPAVVPALIVALWLVALSALLFQAFALAGLNHYPRLTAVTVAATIMTFVINAFFSPQSLYLYAASIRHTLPIAGITAYFALLIMLCRQRDLARRSALLLLAAGGALCFFNAGLAETFALFQLICVGVACLASEFLTDRATIQNRRLFLAVGLLATIAGLIVILTAPGLGIRWTVFDRDAARQNRDIFALAIMTLETAFFYFRDTELIMGFVAGVGLGLVLSLGWQRPASKEQSLRPSVGLARGPLLFAFAHQLLSLLLLLGQMSDDPRVLGRYSLGYSVVLLVNLGLIISMAWLAIARDRASQFLARHRGGSTRMGALCLLALLITTSLILSKGVHWRVSTYFYLTLLALLISLTWQLSYSLPSPGARRAWRAILAPFGFAVLASIMIMFFSYFVGGRVYPRTLSFVPYVFMLSGLIWAFVLGDTISRLGGSSRNATARSTGLRLGSLFALIVLSANVFLDNSRLIPSFQQYAIEWSVREQHIIAERERGKRIISVAPLTFDLEYYVDIDRLHKFRCPLQYYDIDSIVVEDV